MSRTKLVVLLSSITLLVVGGVAFAVVGSDDAPAPEASVAPPPESPEPAPDHVEAVATIDERATDAAAAVLDDGGTAADAAVAAAAVLSVVEPYYSNVIGGETSALYYDAETSQVRSLEAVGPVGEDYERSSYRGGQPFGLDQTIVPAAWEGWMVLLAEHGELDLARLLEPAVTLAREGHAATPELARQVRSALQADSINGPAREVYVPGGTPVDAGDTIVQADFAETLQGIVDVAEGAGDREAGIQAARDHVYRGDLAERIVGAVRDGGGTFTAADMAGYEAQLLETITLEYEDAVVHQNPPPSQGLTMLTALNTIAQADLGPDDADQPATTHLMVEALKLAMADREEWVGDPAFTDVPVEGLLEESYGERQLDRIDDGASIDAPIDSTLQNTTTFQVVDRFGDAVAVTTSTGYQLMAAGDTGVMVNNRIRYMTADDTDSPNFIEPGKKVRYTGNPYLVTTQDGALRMLGGIIGGDTQAQVQTQNVVSVLTFGLDATQAIERPRFVTQNTPGSIAPHSTPNQVRVEESTPGAVVSGLRDRGQNVSLQSGRQPFGSGSMIIVGDDGRSADVGLDPRIPEASGVERPPAD